MGCLNCGLEDYPYDSIHTLKGSEQCIKITNAREIEDGVLITAHGLMTPFIVYKTNSSYSSILDKLELDALVSITFSKEGSRLVISEIKCMPIKHARIQYGRHNISDVLEKNSISYYSTLPSECLDIHKTEEMDKCRELNLYSHYIDRPAFGIYDIEYIRDFKDCEPPVHRILKFTKVI